MTRVSYPSLEHVAIEKRPYPADLLEGCESGLILFGAAFLGHNDAIHFAEAGVPNVTVVDVDAPRLLEMSTLYRSDDWLFVNADAWEYARVCREEDIAFDAVSVDTFTGPALERSLGDLEAWTSIARRFVTVTATVEDRIAFVPRGWKVSRRVVRSSLAVWLVLEPETPA